MQKRFALTKQPLYLAVRCNQFQVRQLCHHFQVMSEYYTTFSTYKYDSNTHLFAGIEMKPNPHAENKPMNVGVTEASSSIHAVSQSVSQSDSSQVLEKYKEYLQAYYNARPLARADKYLPTLEAPYINLAMIRRGQYNPEVRDEFTKRTLHGGVDEILESKTNIDIEDLLTPLEGGKPVKFVLVEGPPGIGKSTFAWEVCRRWDKIESLREYQTVVLLKLREKWVLNAISPCDLFRYPPDPEFSKAIAKELNESQGRGLLLVLDGFDEVSHKFHRNSVIKSILCRQLLPACTIILSTRPSARYTLESVCQPQVDKNVEIIGFTEEERVRYITKVFSNEPELQVNFLKYMFLVPHIKSMMYIPLNCAIIAQVYYESQSSNQPVIPKTRTQLYKALTHSLLVRHMKMKESSCEYTSMLPESLSDEDMEMFKVLAKFAFDSYHKGKSRKVTFFKEDIPDNLVHFGFMNESTEMYASKGVERTLSFLHLSLQEYLAAWHLANGDSYSIEFQVAYHWLAIEANKSQRTSTVTYRGDNKKEEVFLLCSLIKDKSSLVEPAIFLAGITGWKRQAEGGRNHWETYFSHDTALVKNTSLLLRSAYEAQNRDILSHYFSATNSRKEVTIDSNLTQYDCYALSYCLTNSSEKFSLFFNVSNEDDILLVETFVKGHNDHCKCNTLKVKKLTVKLENECEKLSNQFLFWLIKAKYWTELSELQINSQCSVDPDCAYKLLCKFNKLEFLFIHTQVASCEWLTALKSLRNCELKSFLISNKSNPSSQILNFSYWQPNIKWNEAVLDIETPSLRYDVSNSVCEGVDSLLTSAMRSNQVTKMVLSNITRATMTGVRNILLHCPSLATLELQKARLGYDGILFICNGLRTNKRLENLVILDDLQLPSKPEKVRSSHELCSFVSMKRVALPSKTTCTDFLLELNNILEDNTMLKEMKIQSGLFLPLSAGGDGEYCQWTGLGPLQQFNIAAVASGSSPNLRRSFSSSDLTQPQNIRYWEREFGPKHAYIVRPEINFTELFSKRKQDGEKSFTITSFTAPDMEVLQSFSGLDPRLKEYLEISHLHKYARTIGLTCWGMFHKIPQSKHNMFTQYNWQQTPFTNNSFYSNII